MVRQNSEDAVTSMVLFVVAIGIVMVSIFAVFQATLNVAPEHAVEEAEQINYQSEANSLLDILMQSPGILDSGASWDEAGSPSADDLVRIGLLDPSTGNLQLEKLNNLRQAPYAADGTDGLANYEEVRIALGLEEKGLDFHIRTKPTLKPMEHLLQDPMFREPNLKIAYIGSIRDDTGSGPTINEGLTISNFVCSAAPTGSPSWRFEVDILNGGIVPTQFLVVMDIDGGQQIQRQDQTGLVAAGDTTTVAVDVENIAGFTCDAFTVADIDVVGPSQMLDSLSLTNPTILSTPPAASGEFFAMVDEPNALLVEDVGLGYYGDYDVGDAVSLDVRTGTNPANSVVYSDGHVVPANPAQREFTMSGAVLSTGEYTAYMTHVPSGVVATQHFTVSLLDPSGYTAVGATPSTDYLPSLGSVIEVQMLHDLVKQFCPTYFNNDASSPIASNWTDDCAGYKDPAPGNAQPGDVFPDVKSDLKEINDRLLDGAGNPRYDLTNTLVVGSGVAHNAMTANAVKGSIQDWVMGGGTLVVMGSPQASTSWLQAIFNVGSASSSGGLSAPDISHPLLTIPEQLTYSLYDTSNTGWSFSGDSDEYFTTVVEQGGVPVTAVSDAGAFGDGTIILSSWQAYDAFGTGASDDEGRRVMYNFMVHSYRELFVDYGPSLPNGFTTLPASGRALVIHDELGQVALDITVYVFPYDSSS